MIKTEYVRRLPHIQPVGACFFITFMLKGVIPIEVLLGLKEEFSFRRKGLDGQGKYAEQKRHFARIDALLDEAADGPRWLAQPDVAQCVQGHLHEHDQNAYDLIAYCIMSNHVHLVVDTARQLENVPINQLARSENYQPLSTVMRLIKGRSAREANLLLERSGAFWQPESYDHYVRNSAELQRIINYVLQNPVKAGLADDWQKWPYTYLTEQY